jgi:uncharacterized protein involved in outer membrane biogenesis
MHRIFKLNDFFPEMWESMRPFKKYLIGLGIFLVIFTLFGFLGLPPILKSILIKQLSQSLHREVTMREIKTNPYTLSATVRDFMVKDRGSSQTFVSFEELYINLQILSAIKQALIFKEIRLKKPFINLVRHQNQSYNFSDLIKKEEPKPESKVEGKGKPLRFSFNNITIENGSIDFWDGPKQTKHTVRELNIGLPFLSNVPAQINVFVHPVFSAKVNETPYAIQGETKPFADSLETTFDINIKDFDIPHYFAYFPLKLNFKIVSAYLDTQTKVSFIQHKRDKGPSVTVSGNVSLKKVALDDVKNNPLFRLPLIEIGIAPTEPLKKIFHLSKVSIHSPELKVQRNSKGALNIEFLFPEKRKAQPSPVPEKKEDQATLSIDVDEIQLTGGKISFSDLSRKKPFKTILDPIEFKVDHFSNGKEKKTNYRLSLKTEANETIKLEGDLSVDPMRVDGGIEVKSAVVKKYSPYYMDSILFDIEDGHLDFSTRYKYEKGEKKPIISLSGMSANLGSLRLKKRDEKEDFFKVPIISLKDTQLNLTWKELKLGSFFTEKGMLTFNRLSNGEFDLEKLFPPSSPRQEQAKQAPRKGSEKPWLVTIGKVSLDQYTIRLEDRTTADPVTLVAEEISLKAENLSTAKGQRGNASLALRLNQKGTVSANGPFGIHPIFGNLKMGLKGIDIRSLQPYFSDRVKIIVEDGNFSTAGNLFFSEQEGKGVQLTYKGDSSLANFASIDKVNAEDLLKWESLALNDVDIGYNPLYIHINGIALTNFYARLILHPDGSLNLQEVFEKEGQKKEAPTAPQPQKKESPPTKNQEASTDIKIEKVTFQGGEIKFTDHYIKPNYSADMIELGGRISGLTSEETRVGEVELRGKLGGGAPVEITGKINPLKKNFFMDLDVKFKDIDLSPLTPYSGKYVGYPIEKGKLTMELKYLIDQRKLDAKNKFFFDQLTLGDKVESPNATKLPVKLAIALLKDRNGEIKLDIPVSGSLDDPQFSVFRVVLEIIQNLLVKAATSPFSLLGSIFGGGEELSYLEFDYGMATITEPNLKKIDTLIKALTDRPALKLDIEGHVDPDRDREGLKQFFFQRKLKTQKLKEMVKKGEPAVPVDEVKIEPQEYQKYLKLAYKEEKFPKPKNILGMAKDIPAPEMEKLMLTYIEVKESDLRRLASQRTQRVRETILKAGQIQSERIFVIEPKSLAPEKKEKLKDSRVNFKLG